MAIRQAPQIVTQPVSRLCVEPGSQGISLQVEASGEGHQYQWCKRTEDESSLEQTTDQRIFSNHIKEFEQQVNVTTLYPSLYQSHLINKMQMEEMAQEVPGGTNSWKIQRLQLCLPQSSKHFLDVLIPCLRHGGDLGHMELADSLEKDLWSPLSAENLFYEGVNDSKLMLCGGVRGSHEGVYRCRVTCQSSGGSAMSEATHVELVRPDEEAVKVFVSELKENPERGAELAQTLIGRLQKGSVVGYSCLTQAIKICAECKEVVRAFLGGGWSPNQPLQSECGRNLVHILCQEGHTGTLNFVLQTFPNTVSLKATDQYRCTVLHLAVAAGRLETVQCLLKLEAVQQTISYQDNEFRTALHLAVELGSSEMVQALLAVPDVNLGILNKDHLRPVEVAKNRGLIEITRTLERYQYPQSPMSPMVPSSVLRSYSEVSSGYAGSRAGSIPRCVSATKPGGDTPDREVMELQAKLIGTLSGTLSGKRMLKKGVLKKVNRKGSMIDAHFYLLTDVFLYTKYGEISRKYTVYSELSVRGMSVVEVEENGQPVVKNEPLSFVITSKERALSLVASSEEEKQEWIKAVKSAVAGLTAGANGCLTKTLSQLTGAGLGARAPVWVQDNHVTACQLSRCNKKFSFIERKHHCRHCGKVVCAACSSQKRYLLYQRSHGRVCDECIKEYSGNKESDEVSTGVERGTMSGYARRVQGGRSEEKFYKLVDKVLYIYGAHQDTMATHHIPLVGYSIQGDPGRCKVTLTHHQGREDLNESFIALSPEQYESWVTSLKEVSKS